MTSSYPEKRPRGVLQEEAEGEGMDAEGGLPDVSDLSRPLLADPREKGIKRKGLVYSPRKSWWAGLVLVFLSAAIFVITILTAIL